MIIQECLKNEERKFIFYTTSKSNNTQVNTIFFEYCGLLQTALSYSPWIHYYRKDIYSKNHPTTLDELISDEYFKIKFVRCPYERAVSQFSHQKRFPLGNYDGVFSSFKKFLLDLKKKNTIRYHSELDPHFTTQSFPEEIAFKWDAVVHIEQLDKELSAIKSPRFLPIATTYFICPISPRTKKRHWVKNKNAMSLNRDRSEEEEIDFGNLYYPDLYNSSTRELVEKIYELDFTFHPEYTFEKFLGRFKAKKMLL